MNILLLNLHAGSPRHGQQLRPYHLAREWVRTGHRVQIVAAAYSHVRERQPVIGWKVKRELIDGVEYRWMPAPAYAGHGVRRALNLGAYLGGLWRDAARLARRFEPDVVIASGTVPLDVPLARRIARLAGARWVHEVHDPWPLVPMEVAGLSPRHPFVRACQWAEDLACREADLVVSVRPRLAEHLAAHGLDPARLQVVPNGIVTESIGRSDATLHDPALAAHLRALHDGRRLVVAYAGPQDAASALDVLLDAAVELRYEPISIVLVGDGPDHERLQARVQAGGLEHVAMFPPVPAAQLQAFWREVDIAYVGWRRTPLHRFGLAPTRLLQCMLAGRPVVHAIEAGNDLVAEAGCGLTVQPESPAAVAAAVRTLALCSASQRAALGERGRDHVLQHHAYPALARRFLEILATTRPRSDPPATGTAADGPPGA
jgi:glycosyltransferase involved in cell wall biosynthesis